MFYAADRGAGIRVFTDVRNMLLAGATGQYKHGAIHESKDGSKRGDIGRAMYLVAIDAKKEGNGSGAIFTHGGRKPTQLDAS